MSNENHAKMKARAFPGCWAYQNAPSAGASSLATVSLGEDVHNEERL